MKICKKWPDLKVPWFINY